MSIKEKKENEEFDNNITQALPNEPYLQTLPQAEPITLLQFQKLLHPDVHVYIKPNNHKIYWEGQALFIPKEMYDWKVRDVSLRKCNEEEVWKHGSIALFVDLNETYDIIADSKELQEINEYHSYRMEPLYQAVLENHLGDDYALRCAVDSGHTDIVKYLAEHGTDVHAGDDYVANIAAENGHTDVVNYLKSL